MPPRRGRCSGTIRSCVRRLSEQLNGTGKSVVKSRTDKKVVECGLLEIRQEKHEDRWSVSEDDDWRESIVRIVKIMHGKSYLLKVVRALHPSCGFAGCLHGGQQKSNQHADDGDDDEEFDKRESWVAS